VNDDPVKLEDIPRRNVETLRRLGLRKVREMLGR
jgi:ribosomal protein L30/L7E